MSTELVLIPLFPLVARGLGGATALTGGAALGVGLGLAGAAMLTGKAALGVKCLIDRQGEKAHRKAERERALQAEWVRFQDREHRAMLSLSRTRQAIRDAQARLAALNLSAGTPQSADGEATAAGFVNTGPLVTERKQALAVMSEVDQVLDSLPAELEAAEEDLFARLKIQSRHLRERLESGPVILEAVTSFRDAVGRTVAAQHEKLERERLCREAIVRDAEALLADVARYRHLAEATAYEDDLAALHRGLLEMLERSEVMTEDLDLLGRTFTSLKASVDQSMHGAAMQSWLADQVSEHLTDMGYELVEPFTPGNGDAQGLWRLPGGELGRITIHADHRIAFQLCREVGVGDELVLDEKEPAFLQQQESLWCRDLQELLRRLIRDGVPYRVQSERFRAVDDLPIVMVETAQEILDEEEGMYEGATERFLS